VQDPALAKFMTETNPDLELQGDSIPAAGGDLQGWIVGKDNTELTAAIVAAIDALIADGTWGEIMEAGGLTDAALDAPLVNGKEPVN
jgi:polar amino acid transport system substrate-binding protein